jgi:hypothetical protein
MTTDTITVLGTGVGVVLSLWGIVGQTVGRAEKRIQANADKAHEAIGDNIKELRGDVKELNTRVSRIEGKLGLPST